MKIRPMKVAISAKAIRKVAEVILVFDTTPGDTKKAKREKLEQGLKDTFGYGVLLTKEMTVSVEGKEFGIPKDMAKQLF